MDIYNKYVEYANYYKLNDLDIDELWTIIEPICKHEEFIKRMNKPYYHHDDNMLGDHILRDTIVTYKLAKKKKSININNACIIAMFHDLYEEPWQNSSIKKKFFNKHGFVHPIEAAINALTWYPEYFQDDDVTELLIDGIIHHMYIFPVRVFDNNISLNNMDKYDLLSDKHKEIIKQSTYRFKIGKVSICRSKYIEGRILSKADKKVSFKLELNNVSGMKAIFSGKNKKLK